MTDQYITIQVPCDRCPEILSGCKVIDRDTKETLALVTESHHSQINEIQAFLSFLDEEAANRVSIDRLSDVAIGLSVVLNDYLINLMSEANGELLEDFCRKLLLLKSNVSPAYHDSLFIDQVDSDIDDDCESKVEVFYFKPKAQCGNCGSDNVIRNKKDEYYYTKDVYTLKSTTIYDRFSCYICGAYKFGKSVAMPEDELNIFNTLII